MLTSLFPPFAVVVSDTDEKRMYTSSDGRGIVEQCCFQSCSFSTLMTYCGDSTTPVLRPTKKSVRDSSAIWEFSLILQLYEDFRAPLLAKSFNRNQLNQPEIGFRPKHFGRYFICSTMLRRWSMKTLRKPESPASSWRRTPNSHSQVLFVFWSVIFIAQWPSHLLYLICTFSSMLVTDCIILALKLTNSHRMLAGKCLVIWSLWHRIRRQKQKHSSVVDYMLS